MNEFLRALLAFIRYLLWSLGAHQSQIPDLAQEVAMNMFRAGYFVDATCVDTRMRSLARICCRNTVYKFWRDEGKRNDGLRGFANQLNDVESQSQQIARIEAEDELIHLIDEFEKVASPETVEVVRMIFLGSSYAEIDDLNICVTPARGAFYSFARFARGNFGDTLSDE